MSQQKVSVRCSDCGAIIPASERFPRKGWQRLLLPWSRRYRCPSCGHIEFVVHYNMVSAERGASKSRTEDSIKTYSPTLDSTERSVQVRSERLRAIHQKAQEIKAARTKGEQIKAQLDALRRDRDPLG